LDIIKRETESLFTFYILPDPSNENIATAPVELGKIL